MDVQGLGDGFGAQVVGHAFPDHQRSRAAVKPGCVKLIVERVPFEVDRHVDHVRVGQAEVVDL